jgi:hypothetical protein
VYGCPLSSNPAASLFFFHLCFPRSSGGRRRLMIKQYARHI